MDDRLYASWRRYIEENELLFDRVRSHDCTREPPGAIRVLVPGLVFGCTVCGRFHICAPPYDRCLRRQSSDESTFVCGISGHVFDGARMAPGSFHREIDARAAIAAGAPRPSQVPFGRADAHKLRGIGNRMQLKGKRAQWYGKADETQRLRQASFEAAAYQHTHTRPRGGPKQKRPKKKKAEAATAESDERPSSSSTAMALDEGSDSEEARDGGDWQQRHNDDAFISAIDAMVATDDTRHDDAYMDLYLQPVVNILQQHQDAFQRVDIVPGVAGVVEPLVTNLDGTHRHLPWEPMTVARARAAAIDSSLLPHQQQLVAAADAAHVDGPIRVAVMADRLLALVLWHEGYTAQTADAERTKAGRHALVFAVLARDFYRRDETGVLWPIWIPEPSAERAATPPPTTKRLTKFITELQAIPLSPAALRHYMTHQLAHV